LLARSLLRGLREAGFEVEVAPTGEAALVALTERPAHVAIIDVVLPGIDGFETCRRLREDDVTTSVVMLSARGDVHDRVAGLEAGADDYMAKPFSFLELVARLNVQLRRFERRRREPIQVGPLHIDPAARRATREGVELALTAREFDLLEALGRRAGEAVTREWLLDQAWDMNYDERSNVVDAYVHLLRAKLDRPFEEPMLHTVRGAGYRLQAPR
jgi:two-component system OmpR family response regulator